ncbi:MAG: class I SAM-dependent methyltransferase [Ilumatobacteraceae bacterium]|nr:class I SAM-dependent methyltransferase [Ilumatobacteraceae bacterium]
MIIPRRFSVVINQIIDLWVPPILRESWLFRAPARFFYRNAPIQIDKLKEHAFEMSDAELRLFYEETTLFVHQGVTDLSPKSAQGVLDSITDGPVLEVGCGHGWLAQQISKKFPVVATDFSLYGSYVSLTHSGFSAVESDIMSLPFSDNSFPTVVCTHTLEHVPDFQRALAELRRVCSGKLVVVVPRQRPYNVTFNPHVHFFPYRWSLLAYTGAKQLESLELVGGDWLFIELMTK